MERPRVALSRTDNKTYVCPECGAREAIEQMEGRLVPQAEWPVNPPR